MQDSPLHKEQGSTANLVDANDKERSRIPKFVPRAVFDETQQLHLLKFFETCKTPDPFQYQALERALGVPESHLRTWFKNQRAKSLHPRVRASRYHMPPLEKGNNDSQGNSSSSSSSSSSSVVFVSAKRKRLFSETEGANGDTNGPPRPLAPKPSGANVFSPTAMPMPPTSVVLALSFMQQQYQQLLASQQALVATLQQHEQKLQTLCAAVLATASSQPAMHLPRPPPPPNCDVFVFPIPNTSPPFLAMPPFLPPPA